MKGGVLNSGSFHEFSLWKSRQWHTVVESQCSQGIACIASQKKKHACVILGPIKNGCQSKNVRSLGYKDQAC